MKIKKLHLRNIASIERADIDFEHDLVSPSTGTQANIFLISGDTGVGKSVLLDGISLALYKTTPRIAGVVNPKENTFENSQGELISINSLSQYTRLGISPKDDCYSEVIFEGNDGKEYNAKLELGITRNGTYRDARWTVKAGAGAWERVDNRDSQIQKAIGLSFQQFNRMAMLAQGQFAAFLCGDKKEREEILEQLTNTEIFSTYGQAVKNLYDRAHERKKMAENTFQTEAEHILSAEIVAELTQKVKEQSLKVVGLQKETVGVEALITHVTNILDNEKKAENARQRIKAAKTRQAGQEYLSNKQLSTDWLATEQERQRLQQMRKSIQERTATLTQLKRCQDTFGVLSSDLNWRKEQIALGTQKLEQQTMWLQERADRETLYQQSDETLAYLSNYSTRENACQQLKTSLEKASNETSSLKEKLTLATNAHNQTEATVKAKEHEIAQVQQSRDELNPNNINEQLSLLNGRKARLEHWFEQHQRLTDQLADIGKAIKEVSAAHLLLKQFEDNYLTAKQNTDQAKKEYEEALQRCTTMSSSADDTLKSLRARLAEVHAETCPLCGQAITHIAVEEDFVQLLAPLKEEQEKKSNNYSQALEKQNQSQQDRDNLAGQIKAKEKDIATQQRSLQEAVTSLQQEAEKEGLIYDDTFASRLNTSLQETDQLISSYEKQREQVEKYQQQWQQLVAEKKPLDDALNTSQKELSNATHALDTNVKSIHDLTLQIAKEQEELQKLTETLTERLSSFHPTWQQQVQETRQALKAEADEFKQRKSERDTFSQQLEKSRERYQQMENIRHVLLTNHSQWNLTYLAQQHTTTDILSEWQTLSNTTNTLCGRLNTLDETIRECQEVLDRWYRRTSHTENDLDLLIQKEPLLPTAQQYIKDTDEALRSATDALAEAENCIRETRDKMGLQEGTDIPSLEDLKLQRANLLEQEKKETAEIMAAQNQLKANADNQDRLAAAKKKMEDAQQRFAYWDKINRYFGGTRFRTLVQTYILSPLLNNANIYLEQITDRYKLTCNEENEKLSILVLDKYNKNEVRSVTVLSGGERFMVSLALSLALSSLNRPDLNVNILFIDEGFGTLDQKNLDSVMTTLEKLQDIAGQSNRRVGIISHREELNERIRTQIRITRHGEGRSRVEIVSE